MTTTERNDLLNIMSDMHKDAYGFRPRHINFDAFTDAELDAECDYYQEVIQKSSDLAQLREQADLEGFGNLIKKTIELGAGDRKTAIKWIVDGADDWDAEAIVWNMGILYTEIGRALVKEINEVCSDILQRAYES
tara:strand:- start:69 stop:473 length:405 start_codon:yes stop_codon:yes gene_type:complete